MKAKLWKSIAGPLEQVLPGFEPMKLGFVKRHEWLAESFFVASSAYSADSFYLHAFVLPLFVPTDRLYLNYGYRVGNGWDAVTPELVRAVQEALPRLDELASLEGLVEAAGNPTKNPMHLEVRLSVGLITGDEALVVASRGTLEAWKQSDEYGERILDRCRALCDIVDSEGRQAGIVELERRRDVVSRLFGWK